MRPGRQAPHPDECRSGPVAPVVRRSPAGHGGRRGCGVLRVVRVVQVVRGPGQLERPTFSTITPSFLTFFTVMVVPVLGTSTELQPCW